MDNFEEYEVEIRRKKIAESLGNNILKIRKEKGYTREQLAEKSNLSSNYIYGLEKGMYLPGCLAVIDLSNALDVTPAKLLEQYIENKKNIFLDQISNNLDNLSDRDFKLISNIVEYCNNN